MIVLKQYMIYIKYYLTNIKLYFIFSIENPAEAEHEQKNQKNRIRIQDAFCEGDEDMAIEVKLDLVMVKKKMSLTELSERIGISLTNLSLLKTGKVKGIRFSTLEAICRELDCRPGDLLEYVPGLVKLRAETPDTDAKEKSNE